MGLGATGAIGGMGAGVDSPRAEEMDPALDHQVCLIQTRFITPPPVANSIPARTQVFEGQGPKLTTGARRPRRPTTRPAGDAVDAVKSGEDAPRRAASAETANGLITGPASAAIQRLSAEEALTEGPGSTSQGLGYKSPYRT